MNDWPYKHEERNKQLCCTLSSVLETVVHTSIILKKLIQYSYKHFWELTQSIKRISEHGWSTFCQLAPTCFWVSVCFKCFWKQPDRVSSDYVRVSHAGQMGYSPAFHTIIITHSCMRLTQTHWHTQPYTSENCSCIFNNMEWY